jgi:hypothetical protein
MKSASTLTVDRLRVSLRWLWVGPVCALACMVALTVYGLVSDQPGLVVLASTIAAVSGGVWASSHVALQRRLSRATGKARAADHA